jgi:hypothetical protein
MRSEEYIQNWDRSKDWRTQFEEYDRLRAAELAEIVSPHELLAGIRHHYAATGPAAVLLRHYARFIALLTAWPECDVDVLLWDARDLFHIRLGTMRRDLQRAREERQA